jgi:hypothetical protein
MLVELVNYIDNANSLGEARDFRLALRKRGRVSFEREQL